LIKTARPSLLILIFLEHEMETTINEKEEKEKRAVFEI
jgi:hypothetical protein